MHDEHEPARRRHRERMKTEEAQKRYKVRAHKGETPFAVIKACFNMRRFLLRGIEGVRQEWRWASTAFNYTGLYDDAPQPKPASPNSKVGGKDREMRRVISHRKATRRPR